MLTTPDGRPMGQKNVTVSAEQVVVISNMLIDAQVARLLQGGISPLTVVDVLVEIVTNLLAGLEPATERATLVRKVKESIDRAVAAKAGQRLLNRLTPPSRAMV
jgi:hypothetical protein